MESLEPESSHVSDVETEKEGNILLQKGNRILNQDSGTTFGSQQTDEPGNKEENDLEEDIFEDAVDEFPAPEQIQTFYLITYLSYDDQKTNVQMDQTHRKLKTFPIPASTNVQMDQTHSKLKKFAIATSISIKTIKAERSQVDSQFKTFIDESKQSMQTMNGKSMGIETSHRAFGKLGNFSNGCREESYICSSEEELNDVIMRLGYLMEQKMISASEHESSRVSDVEPDNQEVNNLAEDSIYKDAVDDCPARKKIRTFYMVKYHLYEDEKTELQLDQDQRELKQLNQVRFQVTLKLKAKQAELAEVYYRLMTSYDESELYRQIIDEKRKEIGPLHQVLGKLRNPNAGGRKISFICSSEQVLDDVIKILVYRTKDESISQSEVKQISKQVKQLEKTREKVIANASVSAKIEDSLGEKEAIQDQVKLIGSGLDGVQKEKEVVEAKLDQFDNEKKAIEEEIKALEDEGKTIYAYMDKIRENSRELRRQLDKENAPYYQNCETLRKARRFAAGKDIEGLRHLTDTEVETFMSSWISNKAFRDDYEKRIFRSLSMQGLSRDGRTRNLAETMLLIISQRANHTQAIS